MGVAMDEKVHELKYTVPTKFETAPYGQIWVKANDSDQVDIFIQSSKNDCPHWITMGQLLERAFSEKLSDPNFIHECLEIYNR